MSALGQKQTFAVHQPMSALPPKAGHVQCTQPCLLWVKSRHVQRKKSCPLLLRKRTFRWDTLSKKPNDPVEGFKVPLFGKLLIGLRWRSPLGTAMSLVQPFVFKELAACLCDGAAMFVTLAFLLWVLQEIISSNQNSGCASIHLDFRTQFHQPFGDVASRIVFARRVELRVSRLQGNKRADCRSVEQLGPGRKSFPCCRCS